jgi:hypothetical protein
MKTSAALALFGLLAAQSPDSSKAFVPNVPDLTFRIRAATNPDPIGRTLSRTLYFKGARQRQEDVIDGKPAHFIAITQCDERRTLTLNDEIKTYVYRPLWDSSNYFRRAQQASSTTRSNQPNADGKNTTTTNSADTSERRQVGPFTARHVLTTRRMEFGSSGMVQVEERDGWYIDLPVECFNWAARLELWDTTPAPGVRMIRLGNGRRGYPIIETIRTPNGMFVNGTGVTVTSKQDLIEVSEQVLDTALFTVPPGYRPALPRPLGGPDMSKPDTLVNRAELYWQELVAWANYMFRLLAL